MATGSVLLAWAVTAAVGAEGPGDDPITCRVRVLTMDGLGWRSTFYPRLQPVARRGTSAVWTADRALAGAMARQAVASTVAPACSNPGESTVGVLSEIHYVAHVDRVADGPKNSASNLAFVPETARVDEGFRAGVSGRKIDQGILARVALEESHVKAMHTVRLAETFAKDVDSRLAPARSAGEVIEGFVKVVAERALGKPDPRIHFEVKVPEVSHAKVEGEWLIPNDGILLVSLGVETVADPMGLAAVRERVAVLEVEAAPRVLGLTAVDAPGAARRPMPALPSRSTPEGFDPAGRAVDLPPLPEALASADLDRIPPDRPSPQSGHAQAAPAPDAGLARAGFTPRASAAITSSATSGRAPMPALPSRSTPEGVDPSGRVVDLPPLPEAVASADLDRIPPEPNQPSGQARHVVPGPAVDASLARAGFETPAASPECDFDIELDAIPPDLAARLAEVVAAYLKKDDCRAAAGPARFAGDCVVGPDGKQEAGGAIGSFEVDFDFCPTVKAKGGAAFLEAMTLGGRGPGTMGVQVVDARSLLGAVLKEPGRTEIRSIPFGDGFSLEIKATLVPTAAGGYKEIKKADEPAAKP